MYYRDNSEGYNEKVNTDGYDSHDNEYEEVYYNRNKISDSIQMHYPMMWDMDMENQNEVDIEELNRNKHHHHHHCNEFKKHGHCMPIMSMPIYENQMNMCMVDVNKLKKMYPKIYIILFPMVKNHCDKIEAKYGAMYSPGADEMERMCTEICEKCEEDYKDEDCDRSDDEDMRQRRRRRRRGPIKDLIRILFIKDLLGRRRRRRFHDGY